MKQSNVQIDLPGMSPCVLTLSPEDCTNGGATYMFWMKPLDDVHGVILSTMKNQGNGGVIFWVNVSGEFSYRITQSGLAPTMLRGKINNFDQLTNSWVHMTLVKSNYNPTLKIYQNGTEVPVSNSPEIPIPFEIPVERDPLEAVALGKAFVSASSPQPPKNMILDELILCEKALSEGEVKDMLNLWPEPSQMNSINFLFFAVSLCCFMKTSWLIHDWLRRWLLILHLGPNSNVQKANRRVPMSKLHLSNLVCSNQSIYPKLWRHSTLLDPWPKHVSVVTNTSSFVHAAASILVHSSHRTFLPPNLCLCFVKLVVIFMGRWFDNILELLRSDFYQKESGLWRSDHLLIKQRKGSYGNAKCSREQHVEA